MAKENWSHLFKTSRSPHRWHRFIRTRHHEFCSQRRPSLRHRGLIQFSIGDIRLTCGGTETSTAILGFALVRRSELSLSSCEIAVTNCAMSNGF